MNSAAVLPIVILAVLAFARKATAHAVVTRGKQPPKSAPAIVVTDRRPGAAPKPADPGAGWQLVRSPALLTPGRKYRASIVLSGLEASLATASIVKERLQAIGPWTGLRVTSTGTGIYDAIGTYAGKQRTAALPPQVKMLWVERSSESLALPADLPRKVVDKGTDRERTIVDTSKLTGKPGTKIIELPTQHITAAPPPKPASKTKVEIGPARMLPPRSAAKPAAKPIAVKPKPVPPAPSAARQATAEQKAAASKVSQSKAASSESAVKSAALALDAYIASGGRDRSRIADQQWGLGLDTDGIPGTASRDAVRAALGREPKWAALSAAQVTGAVPGGATPLAAAQRLERYLALGGRRTERIAAYQRVLRVSADGKFGPVTRAAADKALGRAGSWPR